MAATVALEGKLAIQRTDAILALGRMAAADEAALRAEGIDPVTVLCAVAESETDVVPFRILRSVASKLDKDRATRVLQVAASNPFQAERYQELLQRQLESLQSNEESSCAD